MAFNPFQERRTKIQTSFCKYVHHVSSGTKIIKHTGNRITEASMSRAGKIRSSQHEIAAEQGLQIGPWGRSGHSNTTSISSSSVKGNTAEENCYQMEDMTQPS